MERTRRLRTVWITVIFALLLCGVVAYLYGQYAPRSAADANLAPPPANQVDPLGMLLVDVDSAEQTEQFAAQEYGVYVLAVSESSEAQRAGIRSGDRITALNGVQVLTAAELYDLLSRVEAGEPVLLAVARDGRELAWELSPGRASEPAAE